MTLDEQIELLCQRSDAPGFGEYSVYPSFMQAIKELVLDAQKAAVAAYRKPSGRVVETQGVFLLVETDELSRWGGYERKWELRR